MVASTTSTATDQPDSLLREIVSSFAFRFLAVSGIMIAFISWFGVNIGSVGQGLSYSLVGVAVYMTFRILDFPDLTVDGSFPIGGAVCAVMIVNGTQPELTLFAAFAAGALTGLVTALINVFFKIEGLLASIIVITGAYTVTLRIMSGSSNLPLLGEDTMLSPYRDSMRDFLTSTLGDEYRRQASNVVEVVVFFIVVGVVLLLLNWFLHTELGLTIRAAGKNDQMIRALGINHNVMVVVALMFSNGLAGLAGALVVQQLGFADVTLGVGLIIRGLAAVMIGEVLLRPKKIGHHLLAAAFGMVVFDVSRAFVFSALDLPTSDIQLVSALVVLIALAAPNISQRWQAWQDRQKRRAEWQSSDEENSA